MYYCNKLKYTEVLGIHHFINIGSLLSSLSLSWEDCDIQKH